MTNRRYTLNRGEQRLTEPLTYEAAMAALPALVEAGHPLTELEIMPAPAASLPTFRWTTEGGTANAEAGERAVGDAAHLYSTLEIASAAPVYAPGTALISYGRDRLHDSHKQWAALPPLVEVLDDCIKVVEAEARRDVPMSGSEPMDEFMGGRLVSAHGDLLAIEDRMFPKVVKMAGFPAGSAALLSLMTAEDRASIWSRYTNGQPWTARTRQGEGKRSIFAAVSGRYTAFDADAICRTLRDATPYTCRGEAYMNKTTTSLVVNGLWHAADVENFGAGDYFKLGWRARSDDSGGSSFTLAPVAVRNLCLNLLVIDTAVGRQLRVIHRGRQDVMVGKVREAMAAIKEAYEPFLIRWGYAQRQEWVRPSAGFTELDVATAWARAVAGLPFDAEVPADELRPSVFPEAPEWGAPRPLVAEAILQGWAFEPGLTVADLVNSVTRLHQLGLPVTTVHAAETFAGQLLNELVSP